MPFTAKHGHKGHLLRLARKAEHRWLYHFVHIYPDNSVAQGPHKLAAEGVISLEVQWYEIITVIAAEISGRTHESSSSTHRELEFLRLRR